MKNIGLLALAFAFVIACSGSKNQQEVGSPVAKEKSDPSQAVSQPPKACPSGEAALQLKGDCEGRWQVKKNVDGPLCEFHWGPTIECPEGTKSLGHAAACYGVTAKPVSNPQFSSCEEEFGLLPAPSSYELWCCPS